MDGYFGELANEVGCWEGRTGAFLLRYCGIRRPGLGGGDWERERMMCVVLCMLDETELWIQ